MSFKQVKFVSQLGVTIFVFYLIFSRFSSDFTSVFSKVNLRFIIYACLVRLLVSPVISMNRWKLFLQNVGVYENYFSLLKISMISAFFGVAMPSSQGADVVRMIMIEKRHKGADIKSTTSSTVLMERIIGFLLLAFLGLVFSLICEFPQKHSVVLLIATINIALWIGVLILTNKKSYALVCKVMSYSKRFKGITQFIEKTYYSFVSFPYKKVLLSSVVLILLLQLCTVLIVYLVFLAFGVTVPFSQHLAFYPIIGILSIIPVSISGLGIREGFFVYFYSLVGVPADVAVSVSLVNYSIEILLMAILGGFVYWGEKIMKKSSI